VRLYVVRHGIAEVTSATGLDKDRRLTPEGRAKMRRAARGLRRLGVDVDVLLTSPLPRARETAEVLAAELPGVPVPEPLPALASGNGPVEVLRQLRSRAEVDGLMIVGHEPTLSGLIALLLTGSPDGASISLKKGAVAMLELGRLAPHGETSLRWLLPPGALRKIGPAQ
jgi:phosphohistidine phosphatase